MPSLQQTTFKDFPSPDIARSLTGPDILQKHSINSLLLEHNEIISRGLPSPIEDSMSLSDLLGVSQASSPTSMSSSLVTNSSGASGKSGTNHHPNSATQLHNHHHHHHLQQNQHQRHHAALGSFSSLASSLAGAGTSTGSDDSASSILSSAGLSTGGGHSTANGSVASNPFNFASLRIPSPSLNSPDLLTGGGLIGNIHGGSSKSSSSSSTSSNTSNSSGISCGGGGGGSGQSSTTHSFYSSLQPSTSGSNGSDGDGTVSLNGGGVGGFDEFRFDTDIVLGSTANGLTTETLKLRRRNISFDCASPTTGTSSPGEGSSPSLTLLCPSGGRNYRNGGFSQLPQSTIPHHQQQQQQQHQSANVHGDLSGNENITTGHNPGGGTMCGFESTNGGNNSLALFGTGNGSLSRSHSPPDHADTSNLLTNLESTSILDMLNYLTLGQSTNSVGGHQNHSQQQQQNHQNQFTPYTSNLGSLYQQQQTTGSGSTAFGAANNANTTSTGGIASLAGLNLNNTGFGSDYERLQSLQALNTLRLLQQTQQLSQLQQFQFNQSLLPSTSAGGSNIYGGNGGGTSVISNSNTNGGVGSLCSGNNNNGSGGNSMPVKNWSSTQQQHMLQHHLQQQGSSSSSVSNGSNGGNGYMEVNLDRIARFHRSSAAHYDATCTWSGVLPPRSNRLVTYSSKIFLGGMPWDISEQSLVQIFKPFGSIKVEWPGKEQQATQPKGYVYIIFESDKQVKALLQACTYTNSGSNPNGGMHGSHAGGGQGAATKINFKISSKRIKSKDVEVIPWNIADSNYVKSTSQKLDPTKTVFVGALHGQLTAEGLATIMNDLFDGVVYVGIDTDKYKYPLGSARVTFNNSRSYMKAVVAAFIEIRTSKFTKKLQVDPYLEDSLCSLCTVQHGPYFCREIMCFRYFCRSCWQLQHSREVYLQNHKPLTRNSKFTAIIGVGPQQLHGSGSNNSNHHQQQQQQHSYDHNSYHGNHHHHHHHHHHGGGNHQSSTSVSTHNQFHHNGGAVHHHHHQQQQSNRLGLLQHQQNHRASSKSPSPSMCGGVDGNSSNTSSNSCSPISAGNSTISNTSSSSSSSCSNSSLSSTNGNGISNPGNVGDVGESSLISSCGGTLNLQQLSFASPCGGAGGSGGGGGGLIL